MKDYEVLSMIYDINTNLPEWEWKNEAERFAIVIKEAIGIVEAKMDKDRTAVGLDDKFVGVFIDVSDEDTATKLELDWEKKYEELTETGKAGVDEYIKKRTTKLKKLPCAIGKSDDTYVFFTFTEDQMSLKHIFSEFELKGVNDEIFSGVFNFDYNTLQKAAEEAEAEKNSLEKEKPKQEKSECGCGGNCGDDCSCEDGECSCGDETCDTRKPNIDENLPVSIKKVKCDKCGSENIIWSFDMLVTKDKWTTRYLVCMDLSEEKPIIEVANDNEKKLTKKEIRSLLKNDIIKLKNIVTECECVKDVVDTIVTFTNNKEIYDYSMWDDDKILYANYLLEKLKNIIG